MVLRLKKVIILCLAFMSVHCIITTGEEGAGCPTRIRLIRELLFKREGLIMTYTRTGC